MVVAEANATNVPVGISEQCGIAPLINPHQGTALPLDEAAISQWMRECKRLINSREDIPSLNLTWPSLAEKHISLYTHLNTHLTTPT